MQFIEDVVADRGEKCLAVRYTNAEGKRCVATHWIDLHDDQKVKRVLSRYDRNEVDVYFGLGTFLQQERKNEYGANFKAVWVDLDAGPDKYAKHGEKVYRTIKDAYADFCDWLDFMSIPEPTYVVKSGSGLHIYWALNRVIPVQEWLVLSNGLKQACRNGSLRFDPQPFLITAIPRLPGTLNLNTGTEVKIVKEGDLYDYLELKDVFPYTPEEEPSADVKELQDPQWGDTISDFAQILKRSKTYPAEDSRTGCQQLWILANDQAGTEEPRWRAGLSIAQNCKDAEKWTHLISRRHPCYSPEETDEKRSALTGKPYTCATFDNLNSNICTHCPHFKKITSPIQLSKTYISEPLHIVPDTPEIKNVSPELSIEEAEHFDWEPPYPYKRKKDGGIVKVIETEGGEREVLIYKRDLVCIDRTFDPEKGEVLNLELSLPRDAKREIAMPIMALARNDVAIRTLSFYGYVETSKERREAMVNFIRACADKMLDAQSAQIPAQSLGWTTDQNGFVLGDRLYSDKGPRKAVSDSKLQTMIEATKLKRAVDLKSWTDALAMYNLEGMEPAQLIFAAALAGPLFRLHGTHGPLIHAYSEKSGLGKTTTIAVALSIWGRPIPQGRFSGLMSYAKDTEVSLRRKLAQCNSIPIGLDEISRITETRLLNLIYEFTQGTEKSRADSNGSLQAAGGSWDACMFMSSNASLFTKLAKAPEREALFARFLELDFETLPNIKLSSSELKENIKILCETQAGVLGHIFAHWLCKNLERVEKLLRDTEAELEAQIEFNRAERYWKSVSVCTLTAAKLGIELGIWEFDYNNLLKYMRKVIDSSRIDTRLHGTQEQDAIADYILAHQDNILTINEQGMPSVTTRPRQQISIRIDKKADFLYLKANEFMQWVGKNGYNPRELFKQLPEMSATKHRVNLMRDVDSVPLRVRCWCIPLAALSLDEETLNVGTDDTNKAT